jgi:S-adenosylmethionine:tRNA ribosyltransferase-isomerase
MSTALAFELTERLEATAPPEHRDEVRMLVAYRGRRKLVHTRFRDLPDFLEPGDLLVVNTSATLPAAVEAHRANGEPVDLHLSTPLPNAGDDRWVAELRRGGAKFTPDRPETLLLPAGGRAALLSPLLPASRLWIVRLELPEPLLPYLVRHGRPIRYPYVPDEHPLAAYQTVFATEPGSAEMPSAGRPFSHELVTALVARGVVIAPIVLHTGVSSLEEGEAPYPERFRVPRETARLVNSGRSWGGRVIAVGTTVVRALETVAQPDGTVTAEEGWTHLVVTPERGVWAVDGLLTGWHEPASSHLDLLRAAAGDELLARSYDAALEHGYRWHEFGDSHLVLP